MEEEIVIVNRARIGVLSETIGKGRSEEVILDRVGKYIYFRTNQTNKNKYKKIGGKWGKLVFIPEEE